MKIKEYIKKIFTGKYPMEMTCNNCGKKLKVSIPKGITFKEYKQNGSCSFCGCQFKMKTKKVKCPQCNDEREVENDVVMAICKCCQIEMKEIIK